MDGYIYSHTFEYQNTGDLKKGNLPQKRQANCQNYSMHACILNYCADLAVASKKTAQWGYRCLGQWQQMFAGSPDGPSSLR